MDLICVNEGSETYCVFKEFIHSDSACYILIVPVTF